jgi:pyridinium-3,5-biscarboxylic acid mononucleotide sulfurtransferase
MTPSLLQLRAPRPEREIIDGLRDRGPALVALSGGVDSSLVAAFVHAALGDGSLAVTLAGPAVARSEVERARRVADAIGIEHLVADVDPLARPEYRANPTDRCFHCRTIESEALRAIGVERGVRTYLDGIHLDDLGDDRPGIAAMDAAGFEHPLARALWTKAEVRTAAKDRKLPNWDQPSDACLASRVAHGDVITADLLERIESAERWLLERGFRRVRVRTRAGSARVEVDPDEVARLLEEPIASELRSKLGELGFAPVTVDPEGYGARTRARRNPE